MVIQYFATKEKAWNFALELDKTLYQVIDFGIHEECFLPYFVSYAKRS